MNVLKALPHYPNEPQYIDSKDTGYWCDNATKITCLEDKCHYYMNCKVLQGVAALREFHVLQRYHWHDNWYTVWPLMYWKLC